MVIVNDLAAASVAGLTINFTGARVAVFWWPRDLETFGGAEGEDIGASLDLNCSGGVTGYCRRLLRTGV
jgi:hypothetical protein